MSKTLRLKAHRLEDSIDEKGEVTMRPAHQRHRGATEAQSEPFTEWVNCNNRGLIGYRSEEEPTWMVSSDDWRPRILDEETRTIVGGRGAKRERKRTEAGQSGICSWRLMKICSK